jgi:hypothetical protein
MKAASAPSNDIKILAKTQRIAETPTGYLGLLPQELVDEVIT